MGISKAILRILCRNEKPWEEEDSSKVCSRLSPSPFVCCEIYEYCMTFEETVSPDKSCFFRDYPPNSRMLVV